MQSFTFLNVLTESSVNREKFIQTKTHRKEIHVPNSKSQYIMAALFANSRRIQYIIAARLTRENARASELVQLSFEFLIQLIVGCGRLNFDRSHKVLLKMQTKASARRIVDWRGDWVEQETFHFTSMLIVYRPLERSTRRALMMLCRSEVFAVWVASKCTRCRRWDRSFLQAIEWRWQWMLSKILGWWT